MERRLHNFFSLIPELINVAYTMVKKTERWMQLRGFAWRQENRNKMTNFCKYTNLKELYVVIMRV